MYPTTVTVNITAVLETLNQILTAGVTITTVALFMYALGFNWRDRIAQTFGLILLSVALIYSSETIAAISEQDHIIQFWLRIKWTGLVMLPAVYLHFSDVVLTLTGRPSRGRRRKVVYAVYIISIIMTILVWFGITVGGLATKKAPMFYLERNQVTYWFGWFYLLVMFLASTNLIRATQRSITSTSRRRLIYLLTGAAIPALTSILFLFHGNTFLAAHPNLFWMMSIFFAALTIPTLVMMAYVVSFFGLTWTDRAIKSRLLRWLLRGPFVVALVLGLTTLVRRYGLSQGDPYNQYIPVVMVSSTLVLQYLITVLSPKLEQKLFWGDEKGDFEIIQGLQDRMLTKKDLNQFLETIVASICDRVQSPGCFVVAYDAGEVELIVSAGNKRVLSHVPMEASKLEEIKQAITPEKAFLEWGDIYLVPLLDDVDNDDQQILGLCGFMRPKGTMDEEAEYDVRLMTERANLALHDRHLQKHVIDSIATLQSEVDYIQNLRASTSYDRRGLLESGVREVNPEIFAWVRDAMTHYWGGPKLTNNPLLQFKFVDANLDEFEGNRNNALRAALKTAIERLRPEGERKYTSDWILYNILDLKFIQGEKVREVARRLSISEADLYRKQRVALENVAQIIIEMEAEHAALS